MPICALSILQSKSPIMRNANFTANTTCQDSWDYINKCAPIAEADDTNRNKSSSRPRRHRSCSANEDRDAKRAAAFCDPRAAAQGRFAGFSEPGGMARGFWAGPKAIANRPGYLSPLPKSSGARIARQAAHSTAALPRTAPHDSALPGADCRAWIAGAPQAAPHTAQPENRATPSIAPEAVVRPCMTEKTTPFPAGPAGVPRRAPHAIRPQAGRVGLRLRRVLRRAVLFPAPLFPCAQPQDEHRNVGRAHA